MSYWLTTRIWCNGCQKYTDAEPYGEEELERLHDGIRLNPTCGLCGEVYQCDECGAELDSDLKCTRDDDACPSSYRPQGLKGRR